MQNPPDINIVIRRYHKEDESKIVITLYIIESESNDFIKNKKQIKEYNM